MNEYTAGFVSEMEIARWVQRPDPGRYSYGLGDTVRIAMNRSLFDKNEYNFSQEEFVIASREIKDGLKIYTVSECNGAMPLDGYFYEHELSLVKKDADKKYVIDKFLIEKKRNGIPYVLVKFKNYPDNPLCNAWIKKSDIVDI